MRKTPAESTRFVITSAVLADLGLLFDNPAGGRLANGFIDAGHNCYAKGMVTTYLARLQGLAADLHEGRAIMVWAAGERSQATQVEPHAWAALRSGEVIDLSLGRFAGQRRFTTGHRALPGIGPMAARVTTQARDFARFFCFFPSLAPGGYLFFHSLRRRPFYFDDLRATPVPVNSAPTRAWLDHFGHATFAKAVLHLHQLIGGRRLPLATTDQATAWAMLAGWKIDAAGELERGARGPSSMLRPAA